MLKNIFSICLLWGSVAPVFATSIYTWVDKDGVTHYSQQAPEEGKAAQLDSQSIEPGKIGSIAPTKRMGSQATAADSAPSAALSKASDVKQAKANCESARQNLNVLTTYTKLNRRDKTSGETLAMTEEQRQQAIQEQTRRVEFFCAKQP
ncbi:DUF4124 domain-containing protein [Shewanella sp. AS16]|uniref:DUF4124 domain-containing protein n=1 Tax=Shewanella sp. AS16 TaxID=2907625 RepID=UPI001F402FEA|nr:DUF4124 domain-containing protein [Shewanella sp. AS16]MCE9685553.1 DUF4124 domain-containing protein [Shewanella sp. AS16]